MAHCCFAVLVAVAVAVAVAVVVALPSSCTASFKAFSVIHFGDVPEAKNSVGPRDPNALAARNNEA